MEAHETQAFPPAVVLLCGSTVTAHLASSFWPNRPYNIQSVSICPSEIPGDISGL